MIGVGVIGCGRWGSNHVRVFTQIPGARVVAVADHHPNLVGALPSETVRYWNYAELLADPAVEAVVVATETASHFEVVLEAIRAGKHVLCEKPLCRTAQEAVQLVDCARDSGVLLMVGHVFLFNPGIVALKRVVDSGELGELRMLAAVRTNLGPIRSDVNAAYDLASHDVAIFNWLLGEMPEAVSAMGNRFLQVGVEDVVFASMRYPSGVLANMRASWIDPVKLRQITVVGSDKMATWDDLSPDTPVVVYDKGADGSDLRLRDLGVRHPEVSAVEPLRAQAGAFLESIRCGEVVRSDGPFGVEVVRALEAINESLAEGSGVVRP